MYKRISVKDEKVFNACVYVNTVRKKSLHSYRNLTEPEAGAVDKHRSSLCPADIHLVYYAIETEVQ